MKTKIILVALLLVLQSLNSAGAQNANSNYLRTITPTTAAADASLLNVNQAIRSIQYFDGLGRPLQQVQQQASPNKADLVAHQEYDTHGRASNAWLPVVAAGNNGALVAQTQIAGKALATYNNDPKAYARSVYENSPLHRVKEQYGPGQDWHNNGKSVKTRFLTNNTQYFCMPYVTADGREYVDHGRGQYILAYNNGTLFVTEYQDEDGNVSYEFKDKLGMLVMSRQIVAGVNQDTHYVYDSYGNLKAVFPPCWWTTCR